MIPDQRSAVKLLKLSFSANEPTEVNVQATRTQL
jgi:hypothetical protein